MKWLVLVVVNNGGGIGGDTTVSVFRLFRGREGFDLGEERLV